MDIKKIGEPVNSKFRNSYLNKVGIRGVEEKKNLETLLSDELVDINKLTHICAKCLLPMVHRTLIWKMILGVIPNNKKSHEFVGSEIRTRYDDLENAVVLIQGDSFTPRNVAGKHLAMLHLDSFPYSPNRDKHVDESFIPIATAFNNIIVGDAAAVESYWLTVKFTEMLHKYRNVIAEMVLEVQAFVARETRDINNIDSHLQSLDAYDKLPIEYWMKSAFSTLLHTNSLVKLWDRLVGGVYKVLQYTMVAILLNNSSLLLQMETIDQMKTCLNEFSEEKSEVILNLAFELTQKYQRISNTPMSSIIL